MKKKVLFVNGGIQEKKMTVVIMNSVTGTQLDLRLFPNLHDSVIILPEKRL